MPGAATRMTDSIPEGRMPGGNFGQSTTATNSPMDPSNVAPVVVFLASDEAQYVNGQAIGAMGYRVTRYSHIVPEVVLMGDGPWTVERLAKSFKTSLGANLKPPRML
jgi:hypothetical protein